jgi:hypothetical protein
VKVAQFKLSQSFPLLTAFYTRIFKLNEIAALQERDISESRSKGRPEMSFFGLGDRRWRLPTRVAGQIAGDSDAVERSVADAFDFL